MLGRTTLDSFSNQVNTAQQSVHAIFMAACFVLPCFGNDDVPLTALPIERPSLVPPTPVEETIDTPQGRPRGLKAFEKIAVNLEPTSGPLPEDYSGDYFPDETIQLEDARQRRDWPLTEFHWQAADVRHRPLYFDHPSLEMCGQSVNRHLQPLLSGTRFFLTIPLLPVKIARTPPGAHISTGGICGPGTPTSLPQQPCEARK